MFAVLTLSALAVGLGVYSFIRTSEQSEFETHFDDLAENCLDAVGRSFIPNTRGRRCVAIQLRRVRTVVADGQLAIRNRSRLRHSSGQSLESIGLIVFDTVSIRAKCTAAWENLPLHTKNEYVIMAGWAPWQTGSV